MYILFYILFHYGLSQDIEYSSLCYRPMLSIQSVRNSRPMLSIQSVCNTLHLLIPNSHSVPPPLPPLPWQHKSRQTLFLLFKDFFFLIWTIFKVFIEFVTILPLLYVLGFWPRGTWDLSSLTRD